MSCRSLKVVAVYKRKTMNMSSKNQFPQFFITSISNAKSACDKVKVKAGIEGFCFESFNSFFIPRAND